jgi:hypothetical protein
MLPEGNGIKWNKIDLTWLDESKSTLLDFSVHYIVVVVTSNLGDHLHGQ